MNLYDTFLDARPPCSKKVASKLHRWVCTLSYKTRALLVLLSFRCVHVSRIIFPPMCTHTQRSLRNQSFLPGRKTKIEKSSHFCLFKPYQYEKQELRNMNLTKISFASDFAAILTKTCLCSVLVLMTSG